MSQQNTEITIGHRSYQMVVEAGQEKRLERVAELFNNRISALRDAAGDMDRDRLLVLAAMMLADDLMTATTERDQQSQSVAAFNNTLAHRISSLCK